jgi:hypothetical protein
VRSVGTPERNVASADLSGCAFVRSLYATVLASYNMTCTAFLQFLSVTKQQASKMLHPSTSTLRESHDRAAIREKASLFVPSCILNVDSSRARICPVAIGFLLPKSFLIMTGLIYPTCVHVHNVDGGSWSLQLRDVFEKNRRTSLPPAFFDLGGNSFCCWCSSSSSRERESPGKITASNQRRNMTIQGRAS